MQSILRYPGGKTKRSIQDQILARAPSEFAEYREPFVGGGGIFFAIPPYAVKKRWINDINPGLVAVYEALRDRPDEFIQRCRGIQTAKPGEPEVYPRKNSKGKKYNARLKSCFDNFLKDENGDQALRYFFLNRTVWGGRVTYDPALESRMYFSNPDGWNITNTPRLEHAARWISKAKITCDDYEKVMNAPGEDVLIYCDPPYVVNTNLTKQSQLYQFGFSEDDHQRFVNVVKKCSHKVCISYDNDENVKEWFPKSDGFLHYEVEWTYSGTSSAKSLAKPTKKRRGKELIITNYST